MQFKNRQVIFIGLMSFAFISLGCSNAVHVYKPKNDETQYGLLKGIPFYKKEGAYKQKTTYKRTYLVVSFQITELIFINANTQTKKPGPTLIQNVARTSQGVNEINKFRIILNTGVDINMAINHFNNIPSINPVDVMLDPTPILNTIVVTPIVDYDTTYYINANAPWFGTGSVAAKLNSDGTLTSTNVSVASQLGSELSQLLPIKDFFQSKLISPAAYAALQPGDTLETFYYVEVSEVGELVSFEALWEKDKRDGTTLPPLPINFANGIFTVMPFPIPPTPDQEENTK